MRIPVLRGIIERRILANYRIDPNALQRLLPAPFRPKLVHGWGVAGICLIRLRGVRPALVPEWLGIASENAAHRIAVEWSDPDGLLREGVYIPRRDTNSRLNALAGGRLFPGVHHHARFTVRETLERFEVALHSDDGCTHVAVRAHLTAQLPSTSIFRSLDEASAFFRAGSLGYSATRDSATFHGLELHCHTWNVEPLEVEEVRSSFFEDATHFPPEAATFDCALLMRGIAHEWQSRGDLCCEPALAVVPRPEIASAQTSPTPKPQ